MTQLKTLKDIDLIYFAESGYEGSSYVNETELKQELRQEAIKWIKELERERNSTKIKKDRTFVYCQIYWIKHFFNIKEEDLK